MTDAGAWEGFEISLELGTIFCGNRGSKFGRDAANAIQGDVPQPAVGVSVGYVVCRMLRVGQ